MLHHKLIGFNYLGVQDSERVKPWAMYRGERAFFTRHISQPCDDEICASYETRDEADEKCRIANDALARFG